MIVQPSSHPSLARTVLTATLTVVAVVLGFWLLYLLRTPISWLVVATFVAVALSGPVAWLSRYMRRGWAIAITLVGLMLILPSMVIAILVPPLVREASDLVDNLPTYAHELSEFVARNETLNRLNDEYDVTQRVQEWANRLPSRFGDAAEWLGNLGLGIVSSVFAGVSILIMTAFILSSGPRWQRSLLALQPPARAERLGRTLERMSQAVGAYVAGALFQALVAGVTTFIVLTILGVPFAAPLAVLTALFDLIPMVGATIGAVLVGIVTVFSDFPIDTIVWIVWAIVYQQVENNLIQPRIQNRAVGIHPFGVIVSVLFGGTLLGVPGAILAVPVAASIQIAVKDWWAWRAERVAAAAAAEAPPALPPPGAGRPGPGTPQGPAPA